MSEFIHDIVDIGESGEIDVLGKKCLYNLDDGTFIPLSQWIKEKNTVEKMTFPEMKSGIALNGKECTIRGDFLGTLVSLGASIYSSAQGVALFSGCGRIGHSPMYPITKHNFSRCACAFTARKLVESNWINQKDEYLTPDTTNPNFHQFEMDSVIYSLFHSSSQQSSLRQMDYGGKKWDIKNEFFWMGKSEIMSLANEHNLDDMYNDAAIADERFVYKFIQSHLNEFSPEAKAVLDKGSELVRKSFKYRFLFDQDHPEFQVNNWDCGFYQLKQIWKEYLKDDFNEFKELYKKFSEKLLPQVYELGFLKK